MAGTLRSGVSATARFVAGMATGVLALMIGGVLLIILLSVMFYGIGLVADSGPRSQPVSLASVGADISRGGGVKLVLDQRGDVIRQRCRGACDDLLLSKGGVRSVRVLNSAGACIGCRRYRLFSRDGITDLRVAGRPVFRFVPR